MPTVKVRTFRSGLLVLAFAVALTALWDPAQTRPNPLSLTYDATSLIFERPVAQGPGTSGSQVVSDPTIRPFEGPGRAATINKALPIDFQGTGRPDLFVCHGVFVLDLKVPCRVLRPQPDGSITEMTRQMFGTGALPSMGSPAEIVTGDFNHDGRVDVFIAGGGYDAPPWPGETNVLLISSADGKYADQSSTLPQTPDFSHSACVGDINGDGHLDIYVGNVFGSGRVGPYFLIGKGDGSFTQKTSGLPPQIQALEEKFLRCLLIDVDRDGYRDLVLGTHGAGGYLDNIVLFNDGTGDFTRRPRYVLPPWPQHTTLGLVAVDINRDGRPDLIIGTTTNDYTGLGLQVLINRGNGTFADETVTRLGTSSLFPSGSYCGTLRLADFNGDGWDDFYCSDGPIDVPNRYWVSRGDGTWSPVAAGLLPSGTGLGIHAVDFDGDGRRDLLGVTPINTGDVQYRSYLNRTLRGEPPAVTALEATPTPLRFAATKAGASGAILQVTPSQTVSVNVAGRAPAWTARADQPWVQVTNGSGSGSGQMTVGIVNPANVLGPAASATANVTVTAGTFTATVAVALTVDLGGAGSGAKAPPFGSFDSPTNNATGLVGAIPVTGWALDDLGVAKVQLWRNCVETIDRPAGACAASVPGGPAGFVYIGDAAFLAGARPDVEALNRSTPQAYKAGWGFLMSTNALPHLTAPVAAQGGQGAFTLTAYAIDAEGQYTLLGTKIIDVDNDHATIPFGSIDTPAQGGTITASLSASFGWAMTQTGKCIDTTSTGSYKVYIDGVSRTLTPSGASANWFPGLTRPDISTSYPGRCNTNNALAAYYIDTAALGLTDGMHTTSWDVIDDAGKVAGIGSRFFNVLIGSSPSDVGPRFSADATPDLDRPRALGRAMDLAALAPAVRSVQVRVGHDATPLTIVTPNAQGAYPLQLPAAGRVALDLGGPVEAGYQIVGDEVRALPAGSTLDPDGHFAWQPPVPFLGPFHLAFISGHTRLDVHARIIDPTAAAIAMHVDAPAAGATVGGSVMVAGWALDPLATTGSGIETLHVWAYRRDRMGAPQFLGAATVGGARPDVAASFGAQFEASGFSLPATALAPGVYDLVVYPWSRRTGRFEIATVVRVEVR